jgi:hypothetical protein
MKKRILLLGFMTFLACVINNITYAQDGEELDVPWFNEVEDEEEELAPIENEENQKSESPKENPDGINSAVEQISPVESSTSDSENSSKDEDNKVEQDFSKDEDEKDTQDSSKNDENVVPSPIDTVSSDEKDKPDSSNEKNTQDSSKNDENVVPSPIDTVSSDEKDKPEPSKDEDDKVEPDSSKNDENVVPNPIDTVSSDEKDKLESSKDEDNKNDQDSSKNDENVVPNPIDTVSSDVAEDDIASKKPSTSPDNKETIQEADDNSKDTIPPAAGNKATNESNTTPTSEETSQNTENITTDSDDSSQENTMLDNEEPSSDDVVSNQANQPVHWVKSPAGRRVIIVYLRANPNYTNTTKVTIIYSSKHGEIKLNHNDTLSYIPYNSEFVGEDSLTYSLTDQNGKTYRSTVKIVIKKKADYEREADIAMADGLLAHTATTVPGMPLTLNIGANYQPNTQQTLTLNPSENSQLIDNQNGTLTYFPNQEFINGMDTLSYIVTNEQGKTKTFIIQIEVGEEDDDSAEWNFSYQDEDEGPSTENESIALVTSYHLDPFITNYAEIITSYSRKKHQLTLIRSENSQITLNRDGTITYLANPGFEGLDIFSYELFEKRTKITTTFTVKVTVKEEQKIPPVVANTIYLVHDESAKDSQLLTVSEPLGEDNTAKPLGPLYKGPDIEGLGIHPHTCRLYATSGSGPSNNLDGYLFLVHPQYGYLKIVGDTGYSELVSLAFHPDGTLWAGTGLGNKINPEGPGLIKIDPRTAEVLAFYSSPWNDPKRKFEGLTWADTDLVWGTSDEVLYATENKKLWAFHGKTYQQKKLCNNLPGEVEALETLSGGLLLFAIDNNKGNTVHVFDPVRCEEVDLGLEPEKDMNLTGKGHRLFKTAIDYNDLESIAWIPECQPKMEIPGPVVVNTDKNDNQSSAKKDNSKSAAKKDNSKSTAKKDNSKSTAKKDNSKSTTKKDNSKSTAKKDNSKSTAKKNNSKSTAKKDNSKSTAKKDNSKSTAKKDNSKSTAKKDNSKSTAKDSKSGSKKDDDKDNKKSSDK